MRALLLPIAAAAAVAAVAAPFAEDARQPRPTPAAREATPRGAPPAAAPARGALAPSRDPASTAQPGRADLLKLPDGTSVATLNGAVDAPPLGDFWGPFPWSPIVGVERNDAGLDWYRHADGSYSTTQMVLRQDLGRAVAMTRVAHPGPAPAATAPGR